MRGSIETVPHDGRFVVVEEDASGACDVARWSVEASAWVRESGEPITIKPTHWHPRLSESAGHDADGATRKRRWTKFLRFSSQKFHLVGLLAAAVVSAAVFFHADLRSATGGPGVSSQTAKGGGNASGREAQDEHESISARELASAHRQLEAHRSQALAAGREVAQLKQSTTALELQQRQTLEAQGKRVDALTTELAEARRAAEAQAAEASAARSESARLKQAAAAQENQYSRTIDAERTRAAAAARELAAAKQQIGALEAQVLAATREFPKLKQAAAVTESYLRQLDDRADALADELATARQMHAAAVAEAAAARGEVARVKQAAPVTELPLGQGLDEERARVDTLSRELATARQTLEAAGAQVEAADREAARLKQSAAATESQLRQGLDEQRARADGLARELAADRARFEAAGAKAAAGGGEAARLKQAAAATESQLRQGLAEQRARADALAHELGAARQILEASTAQAAAARSETARLKQTAAATEAQLKQGLDEQRARASGLARELAAARARLEAGATQAPAGGGEAVRLTQTAGAAEAQLRQVLDEQRARADGLARELAAARQMLEAATAQAAAAAGEAARLEQTTVATESQLRQGLDEQRGRADGLARELAAARPRFEAATEAADREAARLKQSAAATESRLRQGLDEQRARADELARELAAAGSRFEAATAQAEAADREAARLKQSAAAKESQLTQGLDEQRVRAEELARELAAARARLEAAPAQAPAGGGEAVHLALAQTVGAAEAQLRQGLDEQRARADELARELAAARQSIEAATAQATGAASEADRLEQTAATESQLRQGLDEQRARADELARELAAARPIFEAATAQVEAADREAARLKKSAAATESQLRKGVDEQRARAEGLARELAAARARFEAATAQAETARGETARLKKTAAAAETQLKHGLDEQRARAEGLARDLAAARTRFEAATAQAETARSETARLKQTTAAAEAQLRQGLDEHRARADELARELAAARRLLEAAGAQATAAGDEAAQLASAAAMESSPRQTPDEQRAQADTSVRDPAGSEEQIRPRNSAGEEVGPVRQVVATGGARERKTVESAEALTQEARVVRDAAVPKVFDDTSKAPIALPVSKGPLDAQPSPEVAKLIGRAGLLMRQGDIGAARVVLERAVDLGNARAAFMLAETYDPLVLSTWKTLGTIGDPAKARRLYAKAYRAGIKDAKDRTDALGQAGHASHGTEIEP